MLQMRNMLQMGDNQVPISVLSSGQGSDLEIINQYGQLLGEYSKLDDELWLSSPGDEDLQINNISSHEHTVVLEPFLSCADNSSVRTNSSVLETCPQNHSLTLSLVSVLGRRPYSNATKKTMKRTRSKRSRPAKGQPRCRYSATEADLSKYAESQLLDEVADSFSPRQVRTRKLSDLLQLHSGEKNRNLNLDSAHKLNLNVEPVKTCMHCESSMTPQWRDGPMGPKTLCNACGIQFKFGRLSADYRPIRSPTFDPSRHINLLKTRKKKMNNSNLNSASSPKRNQDMIFLDHSEIDQSYTPKEKSAQGMIQATGDLLMSGSRLCNKFPKNKRMRLDNTTGGDQYAAPIGGYLNEEPLKTCMHCESSTTPQWRDGLMGPKTLCNACGIQFKFGRLSADYRPLRSPTFDPSRHTNLLKTKKKKMNNNSLNSASSPERNRDMMLLDCSEIEQNYTPKAKGAQGMIQDGDLLESGSRLCRNFPNIKHMRLDSPTEGNRYTTPNQKKVQEMRILGDEIDQNCAPKANSFQAMTDETSELVETSSRLRNGDRVPKHIVKKKLPKQGIKKCLHCESTMTPQWRLGPMGRNTLCNACGVQYKHGRLFPEYRPLKSPTFVPSLHSHVPKKVLEMRISKISEECAIAGDGEQPVPGNSFTHFSGSIEIGGQRSFYS